MVELLWKVILKINARTVFLATLLLFCSILVVLVRQSARQGKDLAMSGHLAGGTNGVTVVSHPAMAMMPVERIEDPFTSAFLVAWMDLEASRKRARAAARASQAVVTSPRTATATPQSAPPVVKPKPKPKPRWIHVVYQGLIVRTDGVRVALVRDVDGGALYTLAVGDVLEGNTVDAVTPAQVMLKVGKGDAESSRPLPVGVVSRIRKDGP